MGVIGLLFQLKWELLVIVLIAMFLALPAFILDTYKKMYEQKRFADAAGCFRNIEIFTKICVGTQCFRLFFQTLQ